MFRVSSNLVTGNCARTPTEMAAAADHQGGLPTRRAVIARWGWRGAAGGEPAGAGEVGVRNRILEGVAIMEGIAVTHYSQLFKFAYRIILFGSFARPDVRRVQQRLIGLKSIINLY